MSALTPATADTGPRPLDRALAQVLARLDPATDPAVLHAAQLASFAIGLGHAALDLQQPHLLVEAGAVPLPADLWHQRLQASRWVSTPDTDASAPGDRPLVLEGGLLYLRRYREYERRLAAGLRRVAAASLPTLAPSDRLFAQLFPDAAGDADGGQARAAQAALANALVLVTGGPGTGKTTTIARLLVLLIAEAHAQGRPTPRIALAAPTGRAADRMAQSLRTATARLRAAGVDPALCDALPDQARTLHRLLGTVPDSPRFRHDGIHPLAHDVIVVDEASMVDLPLMCKLVEAVPDGARLVLLGDPDQLPSVEAGDVLAAIVAAASIPPRAASPAPAGGDAMQRDLFEPQGAPAPTPPQPRTASLTRVHLHRGFRQSSSLELAPLATAVREGDADAALSLLRDARLGGVAFHPDRLDPLAGDGTAGLLAPWRALGARTDPDGPDPGQVLARADELRVLTALREGPQGAVALNARIEEALAGAQRDAYFHGRLLLVTQNSYRHGLFNGDIGVCLRDGQGANVAWFPGGQGPRAFHPAALPAHESAFAMTVHKSQGSEYRTVWLQLPRQDARPLSRELVYTALTRAQLRLHIAGSEAVLRAALARHVQRVSGLAARLA